MAPSNAHLTSNDPLPHTQRRARRPYGADAPLLRLRSGRVLAGVCGGIARFVGTSPRRIRALWLVTLFPSLGVTAFAYPLLWLLLPLEPMDSTPERKAH
jgi:phage shock protein C